MRTSTPKTALAALLPLLAAVGCSSSPSDPEGAQGNGTFGTPPVLEEPEQPRGELRVGQAIFDCDTHLKTWILAMSKPRTGVNQENITFTAMSLNRLVNKEKKILLEEAVSGPSRNRGIASAALGFSADPEVLPVLVNNAADEDPFVASKALLGIGVLADPETPSSTFFRALRRDDRTEEMTRNLAFAIFQITEGTRDDPDGGLAPVLLSLLDDPDMGVRRQAVLSLGLIKASIAIPPLTDMLAGDPLDELRTAAAWSLGMIGSPGSTRPLMRALEDPDEIVAGSARAALKRIHGEDRGPKPGSWEALAKP